MPEQIRDAFIVIHELKLNGLLQMYFISSSNVNKQSYTNTVKNAIIAYFCDALVVLSNVLDERSTKTGTHDPQTC